MHVVKSYDWKEFYFTNERQERKVEDDNRQLALKAHHREIRIAQLEAEVKDLKRAVATFKGKANFMETCRGFWQDKALEYKAQIGGDEGINGPPENEWVSTIHARQQDRFLP